MNTIDWNFIIVQLIGAIGYTLLSISFYKKEKKQILYMQIIANIFFTIHYFLLDGITGAISNIVGLISYTAIYIFDSLKFGKAKNILSLIMMCFLFTMTIFAYENIYSILPFVAFLFTMISFLKGNEKIIRICGIIAAVCWLVYAIVYVSYAAIVFEVITLIATIVSLIKNKESVKES